MCLTERALGNRLGCQLGVAYTGISGPPGFRAGSGSVRSIRRLLSALTRLQLLREGAASALDARSAWGQHEQPLDAWDRMPVGVSVSKPRHEILSAGVLLGWQENSGAIPCGAG